MKRFDFPKIDLHLHLDGSLSYECFQKLAKENELSLTEKEIQAAVTVSPDCTSLVEYLKCFDLPNWLLPITKRVWWDWIWLAPKERFLSPLLNRCFPLPTRIPCLSPSTPENAATMKISTRRFPLVRGESVTAVLPDFPKTA